jgi:hypothetical protein
MRFGKYFLTPVILGIILALIPAGCDNSGGGPGNGDHNPYDGNPYGDTGTGWPSGSVLSRYGLGGMGQPAGASGIQWFSLDDYWDAYETYPYPVIYITFNAEANTGPALASYFSSNGWTGEPVTAGGYYAGDVTKNNAWATYSVGDGIGAIYAALEPAGH